MLHCIDTMRSSDIWLGWPYDIFNMSMLSRYLLAYMRKIGATVPQLGNVYLTAGSQHLYEIHRQQATDIIAADVHEFQYDFNLPSFTMSPDQIVDWLWEVAEHGTLTTGD